jgi:hypothetical protein
VNTAILKDVATIVGVIVGATSLVFAAWNTNITRRTNRARFWLDLRKFFGEHDEVHRLLRPGGQWAAPDAGPESADDWIKLEAYMGLFETCEDLLASRLIDLKSFSRSYKYRVQNITANRRIVQSKLVERGQYWARFRQLAHRLGIQLPPIKS